MKFILLLSVSVLEGKEMNINLGTHLRYAQRKRGCVLNLCWLYIQHLLRMTALLQSSDLRVFQGFPQTNYLTQACVSPGQGAKT